MISSPKDIEVKTNNIEEKDLLFDTDNNPGDNQSKFEHPAKSSVVVSGSKSLPWWFYILFGMTFALFLYMTALIVLKVNNKESVFDLFPIVPTVAPKVTPVSSVLSPTPKVTEDKALLDLGILSESDEWNAIGEDLKKTDLAPLPESLKSIDEKLGFTP